MRPLVAKYGGTCKGCGQRINPGDEISYGGAGNTYHKACAPAEELSPENKKPQPRHTAPGTNRRVGPCSVCGSNVNVGEGGMWRGADGRWRVTCKECLSCADEYAALPLQVERARVEFIQRVAALPEDTSIIEIIHEAKALS